MNPTHPTHRRGKSVFVVWLVVAAFVAAAQDQRPPVFRGGVTLVNVDAYPRRDGRLIEGLRAEDFQLFEDGKSQKIETFEFIRIEPNAPEADRRDPNTPEEGDRLAADPRRRVFVIYLDPYHTTFVGAHDANPLVLNFLKRTIGATDLFGVLTPMVPARQLVFGRKIDTLDAELAKDFAWGRAGEGATVETPGAFPQSDEEVQLAHCLTATDPLLGDRLILLHREDLLQTSLEELMLRLSALRDERKNVLFISEGWAPLAPQRQLQNGTTSSIDPIGSDPRGRFGTSTRQMGMRDNVWCNSQIGRLSHIDFQQRFRDLLTAAIRANVSFYPVDVGALKTNEPGASLPAPRAADQVRATLDQTRAMLQGGGDRIGTLRTLAENTDGFAIVNTNEVDKGLRRIADDLSAYYLLGYASTNTNLDGKFRRIEVRVGRPQVSVTARRGYLASKPDVARATVTAAAAGVVPPPVTEALGRLARLRTDAQLFSYGVASPAGLDIVAEIAEAEIERGRWRNGADVHVVVTSPGGANVSAAGVIDAGARGALLHVPFDSPANGPWRISVHVSGQDGLLDNRLDVSATTDTLLGAPIGFRGTSSARVALRVVADFQFRRTERLRVEWPMLKALDQRTARVLDRRGQPLALGATVTERAASAPDTPDGRNIVAVDLNLAPLSEGDYLIELVAGAGPEIERSLLAFRVVK
jgi:VWFA-related protein